MFGQELVRQPGKEGNSGDHWLESKPREASDGGPHKDSSWKWKGPQKSPVFYRQGNSRSEEKA